MAAGEPPRGERRTYDSIRDLLAAVQARCAGKSLDETEQILREEMHARGVDIPEPVVRRTASMIRAAAAVEAHPRGLIGQLRGLRFLLAIIAAAAADSDDVNDILSGSKPGAGPIKDPSDPTSAWVDVILDDNGKRALFTRRARLGLMAGVRDQVAVRLERREDSRSSIDAYIDDDRVGTLRHRDGSRYLPAIYAARQRGERGLLTLGIATAKDDAEPRLRIAQTETT